ncbi:MAG: hypothetical protein KatS3mg032_2470 [Cyclobacteriaceae bacterium]|nr:MAG: hypothetical protein KatS3mg032_2470 [Cyclobacteriaceae bacterium]
MFRTTWNLNERGDRQPSRDRTRGDQGRGGGSGGGFGTPVLPGTYKLRITFGDAKDSAQVTVKPDPRVDVPMSVYEQRYAMMKDLQKLRAAATQATDRLREAKEIAEEYERKIKESKRTDLKEAADKTKAMKDSVNALFDFILGKEDNRQGIVRSPEPSPVSYIQTAAGYIMRSRDPISETDRRVFKHAEDKIDKVVKRVNYFFDNTWKEYRTLMESIQLSPFKDYQPIKYR